VLSSARTCSPGCTATPLRWGVLVGAGRGGDVGGAGPGVQHAGGVRARRRPAGLLPEDLPGRRAGLWGVGVHQAGPSTDPVVFVHGGVRFGLMKRPLAGIRSSQGAPLLVQKPDGLPKIGVQVLEVFDRDLQLGRVLVLR
jgi:hypothetical protein